MSEELSETVSFESEKIKSKNIRSTLDLTNDALIEKGYDSIIQITGYLITNDPAYISSHKNARSIIQSIDRYDLIEELVRYYLKGNNK